MHHRAYSPTSVDEADWHSSRASLNSTADSPAYFTRGQPARDAGSDYADSSYLIPDEDSHNDSSYVIASDYGDAESSYVSSRTYVPGVENAHGVKYAGAALV